MVTADHGSVPNPRVSGGFRISAGKLHQAIQEAFGGSREAHVVEQVKQTEIFINEENLAGRGATLDEVAEFVMELTEGDLFIPGLSDTATPGKRVFEAVFPSAIIPSLRDDLGGGRD